MAVRLRKRSTMRRARGAWDSSLKSSAARPPRSGNRAAASVLRGRRQKNNQPTASNSNPSPAYSRRRAATPA
ncbi:MAG TPA: hypothetical protein ENN66_07590 [Proteobacteria bacterium]|nr:hypothetical protein [Pseudomonadota bacterium]